MTPPSEPEEKQMSKEPELSLHAMDGSASPKTLRLLGQVKRKPVSILLDTRSTHNFIDSSAVQRTGLMVTLEPSFTVKVVGDEKLYSESLCKEVHIKCQGI